MKQCPECGSSCEDRDVVCKSCGFIFNAQTNDMPSGNSPQPNRNIWQAEEHQGRIPSQAPPPYNEFAIASLVLGIVSIVTSCCSGFGALPGIAGLILGIVALSQIKKTGQPGYGLAVAGIILGAIAIVLGIIMAIIGFIYVLRFLKYSFMGGV